MAIIKDPEITVEPVEKEKEKTVSKVAFDNLQQSFIEKCKQYDELAAAYKNLQVKYITDAEAAKHFVKTALIGLELLYPTQNKGGRN